MKLFLGPAIALMNRLGYTRKFALLWLILLAAISVVVYGLFTSLNKEILNLRRELAGVALIKPISQAVQAIQQHRGSWAVRFGDNEAEWIDHGAKEIEAAFAFDTMEGILPPRLKETAEWQSIKTNWVRLENGEASLAAAESFAAHTRVIDQILLFEGIVADQYNLTLDSQLDSYYLIDTTLKKLPDVLEHLGQLRAYGVSILNDKRINEEQKINLYNTLGKLEDTVAPLKINLEKTGGYNPAIKESLGVTAKDITDSAQLIVGRIKSDILDGRFNISPKDFFALSTSAIDRSYTQMYETLLPTTEALLKKRIAHAENVLYTSIGIALILILVTAYFAAGIYCSIIDSIQSLARSSRAIAGGNLRERIHLGTRDELSQVGDRFNEMADGFSALLESRRQTEDALNQFKSTLDQIQDCVFMFAPDTLTFFYANRGAVAQVGYSIEELLQLTPLDLEPEFMPESFRQMLQPMLAGRQTASTFETVHRHKDGHLIPVEVALQYVHPDGVEGRFVAIVRDITERKQTEKSLRESQEKLRAIFEGSNDAIMLLAGNNFLDCNKRTLEMFGMESVQEFALCHPADLSPPTQPNGRDSLSAATEKIKFAFEFGASQFEWIHRRKNGEDFPAEVSLSAFDYGGERVLQATVRDISERKESSELRSLKFALDQHAIVSMTDIGGNITYVNDKFCEISQYSRGELIGQNHRILKSDVHDAGFFAHLWETISKGKVWRSEVCNRRKDGEKYWVESTIVPLLDDNLLPYQFIAIRTDITRIKQVEKMLASSKTELELRVRERTAELEQSRQTLESDVREMQQLNRQLEETHSHLLQSEKMASIGQLAAGVAHEINNPIGYVYSNLGTLEKYVQDVFSMIDSYEQAEGAITDEAVRAQLKMAREKLDIEFLKEDLGALMSESKDGITRVKQIVQNLKDFSHVDVSEEWHFADLHKGIDSTLNIVHNEIKYKASVIKEYGVIPEVECLSSQLNQVFMNLLVNAAHAIEERGTITVRTGQQDEQVWVEIADTGKGIAPEHMQKIFDPFFTTKPVGKGTGLGLSLSYGIIQKHHGRIEVWSEAGKGTTFRVWLPVVQPQANSQDGSIDSPSNG